MSHGAVIHAPYDALVSGTAKFALFLAPAERASIEGISFTRSAILVNWLDNVRSRVERYTRVDDRWVASAVDFFPPTAAYRCSMPIVTAMTSLCATRVS